MDGPDHRGPTLTRRLTGLALLLAFASLTLAGAVSVLVTRGVRGDAATGLGDGGAGSGAVSPAGSGVGSTGYPGANAGAGARDGARVGEGHAAGAGSGADSLAEPGMDGGPDARAQGAAEAEVDRASDAAALPKLPQGEQPQEAGATLEQAIAAAAFAMIDLASGKLIREQKAEWLDTPVWPGSIAKLATFAAAIDAGQLTAATRVTCTRRLTLAGGRKVDCTHPPLAHALSPTDALAQSCNVFTATIARSLTRDQLSSGFVRMGLSPVPADADLIASALGLDGAKVAPRKLIEAVRRAANIPLLRDGLRASARIGTSSAFAAAGIEALAKTGTAPMRGGRALGLVAAITPADSPRLGIIVALPGGSGAQAAETAAAILRDVTSPGGDRVSGASGPSGAAARASRASNGSDQLVTRAMREVVDSREAHAARAANEALDARGELMLASAASDVKVPSVRVGQPTARGYDIEQVELEEYLARVVAGETSDATPPAVRQAVAVAARTFATVNRGRHADDGFDLCTLTHCQVPRPATRSSRQAVAATRSQVLVDERDNRLAPVFYSASCGGTLADARAVMPNADPAATPWLASRADPAGIDEVTWRTEIPADELLRALKQNGFRGDTLRNLVVHAGAGTGDDPRPLERGERGDARDSGTRNTSGARRSGSASASEGERRSGRAPTPSTPANLGRNRDAERRGPAPSPRDRATDDGGSDRTSSASRGEPVASGNAAGFRGVGSETSVTLEGLSPSTISIDDFRRIVGQQLGWQLLKSTRFTVQRTSRGYRFNGRGHGHGVGLCVLGASALAARGDDVTRILATYFPGLRMTTLVSNGASTSLSRPAPRRPAATAGGGAAATSADRNAPTTREASTPASAAAPAAAIKLRLPSGDEGERARLVRLIGTQLKELTLDLSLPSPSTLDVVVHPTVAAYRRATNSPSWTSAATILLGEDITLHFAPLSAIDRGSMLTQTVRHELVHVLTIRALFHRPRWVHEGLALHLAGERVSAAPDETSRDALKCPSDRDLMRPSSRNAFDRAYSRAAACVARDLAAGRDWRELGAR